MGAATIEAAAATITFACGQCSRKIRCPASYAGKAARCPGCKTAVRAPLESPAAPKKPAKTTPRPAQAALVVREGAIAPSQVDTAKLVGGCAAMLGAVVWFLVGLSDDVIFFYPPVMFVLGLGSVVRACAGPGRED